MTIEQINALIKLLDMIEDLTTQGEQTKAVSYRLNVLARLGKDILKEKQP